MPAWPDVVGHGAVGREETLRMPGGCAPLHVVRALPRRTMGVLTPVMQRATLAVCDPGQDLHPLSMVAGRLGSSRVALIERGYCSGVGGRKRWRYGGYLDCRNAS